MFALDTHVTSISMKPILTVTIGSSVVVVCNITLNTAIGPDLSALKYSWYFDYMMTNLGALLHNIDGKAFTSTLQITSAQPSNAGVYQCSAGIVCNNTITNSTTQLCVKGIICVNYLACLLSSLLVDENNLLSLSVFQDLQLGEMFIHNCVLGSITGLSISWWKNNTLFVDNNSIKLPPLLPSDNNTNYTCIIRIPKNPSGCPQNQFREYVIRLKS